ncbi:hypothetical protein TNCV_1171401 [Trichonephila clavipes]|nr:hypothetical protein TNCV_1171401 [Trichonephila clavipes]
MHDMVRSGIEAHNTRMIPCDISHSLVTTKAPRIQSNSKGVQITVLNDPRYATSGINLGIEPSKALCNGTETRSEDGWRPVRQLALCVMRSMVGRYFRLLICRECPEPGRSATDISLVYWFQHFLTGKSERSMWRDTL